MPANKKDENGEVVGHLDTGMGGFDLEGNLHTYDVGNPDLVRAGKEVPRAKTINLGIDNDPTTGKHKDLSKTTRLKLSNYISDVTKGVEGSAGRPNRYIIERSSQLTPPAVLESGNHPAPLAQSTNSWVFTDISQEVQGTGLNSYSPAYPTIQSLMKKGAAPSSLPDGHSLLQDVTRLKSNLTQEPGIPRVTQIRSESPVSNYTSAVLKENRFTKAYGNNLESTGGLEHGEANAYYIPVEKGVNYLSEDRNAKRVSPGRMKSVGIALSMRASQELSTMDFNAPFNPSNTGNWLLAQLPSPEQLGIWKPESFTTNADDVLDAIKDAVGGDVNEISISKRTYGALNNVNDVFTGADAVGMSLLATVMAMAAIVAMEVLMAALIWTGNKPEHVTNAHGGIYKYGASYFEKPGQDGFLMELTKWLNKFLGIPYVKNDFEDCVRKGYHQFFWPILEGSLTANIGDRALDLVSPMKDLSSGYYAVASRNIIRSILIFAEYAGDLNWSLPGSYLKVLELLVKCRLLGIIHLFAKIGDKVKDQEGEKYDYWFLNEIFNSDPDFDDTKKVNLSDDGERLLDASDSRYSSRIDAWQNKIARKYAIGAAIGNRKILDSRAIPKLVWSIDRAPDLNLGSVKPEEKNESRINTDVASKLEQYLDSQYVPFYFHDLRTNEILSFHAFIDSITDTYTPSYDTTDAIGRVEPIATYKGTQRKFGLSFYIVSTGQRDIDVMYDKINKLITMVYPQYTKGKEIFVDENNFYTQPFSQLVGSSPLIRLRLGDIATSNYNISPLARLFGLGHKGDIKIDGKDDPNDLSDFFNPANNSIVKYFENNKGKGLAGHIDSLDFDWSTNTPWEIRGLNWDDTVEVYDEKGDKQKISSYYRAPKMCKVTLGFMPIFDITPGLDYKGVNRAPVYLIGQNRT